MFNFMLDAAGRYSARVAETSFVLEGDGTHRARFAHDMCQPLNRAYVKSHQRA